MEQDYFDSLERLRERHDFACMVRVAVLGTGEHMDTLRDKIDEVFTMPEGSAARDPVQDIEHSLSMRALRQFMAQQEGLVVSETFGDTMDDRLAGVSDTALLQALGRPS